MSLTYTNLLPGTTKLSRSGGGITYTERRLYESVDLEEIDADLPAIFSEHATLARTYLLSYDVERLPDSHTHSIVTLNYGPREAGGGAGSNNRPEMNADGEIWEWMMVSQMIHITSLDKGKTITEYNDYEGTAVTGGAAGDSFLRKNLDKVEGIDVYRATGGLRVTKQYANVEEITTAFRQKLFELQASVNDSAWLDWGEQEVLFLGSTVRLGAETGSVDFNFLFGITEENVEFEILDADPDITSNKTVTVPVIYPFQYVWQEPHVKTARPNGAGTPETETIRGPWNVKIADVYPAKSFTELGLTGP